MTRSRSIGEEGNSLNNNLSYYPVNSMMRFCCLSIIFLFFRKYTYREFERIANKPARRFSCSSINPPAFMEKVFWHELARGKKGTVEYGVNVEGSAFSCDPNDHLGKSKWNLKVFILMLSVECYFLY